MLSREEILSQKRAPVESLNVPEWGGKVWFTPMSGLDSESIPGSEDMPDDATASAHILVRTVTDEAGVRIFKNEDAAAVAKMPFRVINKPREIAMRINGLVAEEIKNSEADTRA